MASVNIKEVDGGETTSPVGTEGMELDNGTTSTWIQMLNLVVRKIRETSGPTALSMGAVSDGQYLKRSGSTIIGDSVSGLSFSAYGITGFTLSNNSGDATNDIDIAVGSCLDSTFAYSMQGTAMTKQLDATWAVGTAAGGLDTGAKAASTFYYVWVIRKDSDASIDYLFSASASAPTMPAGYTYKRFTGWSFRTDAAGTPAIIPFIHAGNRFFYKSPPGLEVSTTSLSTTRTNSTRTYLPAQRTLAFCNVYVLRASANAAVYFSNPDMTDLAISETATPLASGGNKNNIGLWYQHDILTDASGVISYVAAGASTTLYVAPLGWTVLQ